MNGITNRYYKQYNFELEFNIWKISAVHFSILLGTVGVYD